VDAVGDGRLLAAGEQLQLLVIGQPELVGHARDQLGGGLPLPGEPSQHRAHQGLEIGYRHRNHGA
jgi:hypothetical protein